MVPCARWSSVMMIEDVGPVVRSPGVHILGVHSSHRHHERQGEQERHDRPLGHADHPMMFTYHSRRVCPLARFPARGTIVPASRRAVPATW